MNRVGPFCAIKEDGGVSRADGWARLALSAGMPDGIGGDRRRVAARSDRDREHRWNITGYIVRVGMSEPVKCDGCLALAREEEKGQPG